jgi:hypothetical protein
MSEDPSVCGGPWVVCWTRNRRPLDATSQALDAEAEDPNEDERLRASERLKAALVNLRNILEDGA